MIGEEPPRAGFVDTWTAATFRPREFFSRPAGARSRLGPVKFAMLIGACFGLVRAPVEAMFGRLPASAALNETFSGVGSGALGAAISVYIFAAVIHFWLIVTRVKPRPFKETLECVGYAMAPALFGIVPLVGALVGGVWRLVVLGIGIKNAQRTTAGRAAFAIAAGPAGMVLLGFFLRSGLIEPFKIASGGLMPTLMVGDHIFINKLAYGPLIPWTDTRLFSRLPPQRGDVMVFKFPENKNQDFVERAIAMPGDTLEVINGRPILNGWLVPHCHVGTFRDPQRSAELYVEFLEDRSYLTLFDTDPDAQTCKAPEDCGADLACRGGLCGVLQGPFKVAPDETWVMGDNRNNSHDSRTWRGGVGAGVPFENIKGRAMFVWMSFGPDGSVVHERLFVSILGAPVLPAQQQAALGGALEKCIRERPPVAETTPPSPGASLR